MSSPAPTFMFPPALVSRADLARLAREVEALDNELEAQKVRAHSSNGANQHVSYHMPTMTRSLSDFIELNKLDLADDRGRMTLKEQLRALKDKAPVVHMTFASEADLDVLRQLVAYMRKEFHPQALLSVGLQPNLVGGVYMRTPSHVHDFSVRSRLKTKRGIIGRELERLLHG